jgi:hypothetical protein
VKLEDILILETSVEMNNLYLLMCLETKRKNSKGKINGSRPKSNYRYIYLRPFLKVFLKMLKSSFKLVLYSFKDPKTVQSITHSIVKLFEEELFDASISLPKKERFMHISEFL